MDIHCYNQQLPDHPLLTNFAQREYGIVKSLRNGDVGTEEDWKWDWWDWERVLSLAYDIIDFWYENGTYFHVLQRQDNQPFEVEDFRCIQEETLASGVPMHEVNILLFF